MALSAEYIEEDGYWSGDIPASDLEQEADHAEAVTPTTRDNVKQQVVDRAIAQVVEQPDDSGIYW